MNEPDAPICTKRDGLGRRCTRPAAPNRKQCAQCLALARNRYHRLIDEGRCGRCGEPAAPGRKFCEGHLEDAKLRERDVRERRRGTGEARHG